MLGGIIRSFRIKREKWRGKKKTTCGNFRKTSPQWFSSAVWPTVTSPLISWARPLHRGGKDVPAGGRPGTAPLGPALRPGRPAGMQGSPARVRHVGPAMRGVWDTRTTRDSSACAPHVCGPGARLLPQMGATSAPQLPAGGMRRHPPLRLRGRGKHATACWDRTWAASAQASGEPCDEGSKLPSETRMRTSVYARLADRVEKPVIYDFVQYQTFPALPPPMATEEAKASKRHRWYPCSVPDLIFACWWMFCNVFIIAIIILQ